VIGQIRSNNLPRVVGLSGTRSSAKKSRWALRSDPRAQALSADCEARHRLDRADRRDDMSRMKRKA